MSGSKSAAGSSGVSNGLDCEICLLPFDLKSRCPRMLNCGHTLCEECARKLMLQDVFFFFKVKCPFDRIATTVESGAQNLPRNFTVERILNAQTPQTPPVSVPTGRCSINSSHEAWFTCEECKADFCESCFDNEHDWCEETEVSYPDKIPSIDKPHQAPKCKKHPTNIADFVCQDPACKFKDKVVCNTCLLEQHKHHKHVPIEEVVAENQKKLKEELIRETLLDDPEECIPEYEFRYIKDDLGKSKREYVQQMTQIEDHYDNEKAKAVEEFVKHVANNQALATMVLGEKKTVPGDQKALRKIRNEIRGRLISKKKLEDVEDLVERHKSACEDADRKMDDMLNMVSALRNINFTLPYFERRIFDPKEPMS